MTELLKYLALFVAGGLVLLLFIGFDLLLDFTSSTWTLIALVFGVWLVVILLLGSRIMGLLEQIRDK